MKRFALELAACVGLGLVSFGVMEAGTQRQVQCLGAFASAHPSDTASVSQQLDESGCINKLNIAGEFGIVFSATGLIAAGVAKARKRFQTHLRGTGSVISAWPPK